MIYLLLKGGLGNQLFEIFTLISYSMRENQKYKLPLFSSGKRKNTYWDTILINLKEINFSYNKIDSLNKNSNLLLNGYFQSYKYFINDYEKICELIHLNDLKNSVNPIYNNLITNDNTTISVHFRLGDYKEIQDTHPILNYHYYYNSLKYLITQDKNYNVLYFCEKEDTVIVEFIIFRLKKHFININFIQCPFDIEDWQQLLLMSLCDNHIIANSTFSWWGAYFNSREKTVCYPSTWFGPKLQNYNLKDLFPSDWTKIKC